MLDYTPPEFQLISHEDVIAMDLEQTFAYAETRKLVAEFVKEMIGARLSDSFRVFPVEQISEEELGIDLYKKLGITK